VTKKLARGCSGWRMAGGILPAVTHGGGGRLCHGGDVPAYRGGRRGSMRGSKSFLEVLWSCLSDRRGVGDDGAGLVRYADSNPNCTILLLTGCASSAHARVLQKYSRHACAATRKAAAPGRSPYAPLPLCSRTTGPQPARAWPVALHTHAPAETNRAGRTLPHALADAPVQFRLNLRVLQLRRPLHLLRCHLGRGLPTTGPHPPWPPAGPAPRVGTAPRHIRPSASARAEVRPHRGRALHDCPRQATFAACARPPPRSAPGHLLCLTSPPPPPQARRGGDPWCRCRLPAREKAVGTTATRPWGRSAPDVAASAQARRTRPPRAASRLLHPSSPCPAAPLRAAGPCAGARRRPDPRRLEAAQREGGREEAPPGRGPASGTIGTPERGKTERKEK
jgi:hypothetical protein